MKKQIFIIVLAATMLISCAGAPESELPQPAEIYDRIFESINLPEMIDLPSELFSDYYGIEPEQFESAIAYRSVNGLLPDEIIIIKAVNKSESDKVYKQLKEWLEYKEKSAENYLFETISTIRDGVIRQDGLTVSMIVCEDIDEVVEIYESIK